MFFVMLVSCTSQQSEVFQLQFEHDLIPEGIAVDGNTDRVYLNSLKREKIVFSKVNGQNPATFIDTREHGYLSGFGMTIKDDTLYALGNSLTKKRNSSVLLLLQLSTGHLIDSYSLNDGGFHYLNDLATSPKNNIFMTDSESNRIYQIQRPFKNIELFMDSEEVSNSNGIAISDDGDHLYLASTKGIRIVAMDSKEIVNRPNEKYTGIDGLKFYGNNLYGIVNMFSNENGRNGLYKYTLNTAGTKIVNTEKPVTFEKDDIIPTTFAIANGAFYFVANTQLDNFDEDKKAIVDPKRLQPYRLRKVPVE
ncbi:SMP-30/gluconolactonase/LRE family protein [Maribacter sp. 2-571]|uniref:SMP-30/gluconolactonase/LRE family protein n=1 Tax=Maribacter sp. 2-571 TaxID=3417569 RepID=UPI003D34117F